jgi:hypothetical protein
VEPSPKRREASFRSDPAQRESEESAKGKLIESARRIELVKGIGQLVVLQIPPRALRTLVGMTGCAADSEVGSTPRTPTSDRSSRERS